MASNRGELSVSVPDPNERLNRSILGSNLAVHRAVVRPVTKAYDTVVPKPARDRVTDALKNLDEPRIFANNILQGRLDAAVITFGRFFLNSSIGVGGIFDVATAAKLPKQTGDFGQTLFVWGVPSGSYAVLPVLGPGTPRDHVGRIVDYATDPVSWGIFFAFGTPGRDYAGAGLGVVRGVEETRILDLVEDESLDVYSRLKSLWEQKRAAELREAVGGMGAPALAPIQVAPPPPPAPRGRVARPVPARR